SEKGTTGGIQAYERSGPGIAARINDNVGLGHKKWSVGGTVIWVETPIHEEGGRNMGGKKGISGQRICSWALLQHLFIFKPSRTKSSRRTVA
ncbi:unnamed protein product, partial [Choristocarpus tenellus]